MNRILGLTPTAADPAIRLLPEPDSFASAPRGLSRAIAWRTAALQSSLSRRLGENDAWIAATALSYEATLIGRERAFERVPRLDYLPF